ncbi:hypothetical protein FF100_22350 [Methylobacterium terricola]|uniref:Uncharacterized protein n=1 Tax=Methylobacterium terricola TaxID=2583531 RepID=A0A5C4LE63_9HYPH|nr:hypothetical protein [Methylobacterium terricola]TNC10416.1 hypothetical protein FF100_22350 [Methylobacterium terricola]
MTDVLQFPSRLSGRTMSQICVMGEVGWLEVVLLHAESDDGEPMVVAVRAGTAVAEIATVKCELFPAAAVPDAHVFADALYAALRVIRERGVLRDAFLGPQPPDDGQAA